MKKNRSSTYRNYTTIWKNFNKFVIRLDIIPIKWEQRVASLLCVSRRQRDQVNNP